MENPRQHQVAARCDPGELQRLLQKQGVRYTTMLAVSIFLAIAALVAVCVMGYLVMTKLK